MPANHKVSVAWQIVFTFIPIVNFWAFYRIRKLRKYAVYVIAPEIVIGIIATVYTFGNIIDLQMKAESGLPLERLLFLSSAYRWSIFQVISWGLQAWAIYLVIIWSRQHNRQVDQPASQSAAPAA